jgi:hypothetical protein
VDSIQEGAKQNKMRLYIDKTKHMIINQTTAGTTNITINNLEQVKNSTIPNEYRTIALTSAICKVFEWIIIREKLNHTKKNGDTNKQNKFLPRRNTMDALVQVIEDWGKARDEKKAINFLNLQNHSTS